LKPDTIPEQHHWKSDKGNEKKKKKKQKVNQMKNEIEGRVKPSTNGTHESTQLFFVRLSHH
jgi:hypothetical protein